MEQTWLLQMEWRKKKAEIVCFASVELFLWSLFIAMVTQQYKNKIMSLYLHLAYMQLWRFNAFIPNISLTF